MSSNICIYIKTKRYLRQYLEFHFGSPVVLPKGSPDVQLLERYLIRLPDNAIPVLPVSGEDWLGIQLPFFKNKDPRTHNFLPKSSEKLLLRSLEYLFFNHLWTDLLDVRPRYKGELLNEIESWCEANGIPADDGMSVETIRQKFYRMRKLYSSRKNNIVLS